MRVIEIREHGAPEVLVSSTRPDPAVPTAGSGEVFIATQGPLSCACRSF